MNSRARRPSQLDDERLSSKSPPPGPGPTPRTVKRTRTGCLTCRARKVKCDEARPKCQNCIRCMHECKWPVVDDVLASRARRRANQPALPVSHGRVDSELRNNAVTSASDPSPSPSSSTRKSLSTSCTSCRAAKCRCSQERPFCARCRELGIVCKYRPANTHIDKTLHELTSDTATPEASVSADKPETAETEHDYDIDRVPKPLLHQYIQAFFTNIYPCQANGFIHRGTLLRNFQTGRIDRKLLLAICASASRFVDDADETVPGPSQSRAEAWAKEAKSLLVLEDMTSDTVAAALILAKHEVNCGSYSSAWMISSIATRAALALGLNKENHTDDSGSPFSEQETRRRLFWACYCLDRMMSTGLPELVVLRTEHICLQLPCEEQQYQFGIPSWTPVVNLEVGMPLSGPEHAQAQRDIGMFGQYVQIMQMRYSILKYVRNQPEDPKELPPWDPSSTFAQCANKMSIWKQSLLPQFQLLPDTIYVRQSQDQLSTLIMLHVWYEQCMTDLYRIVMPGFPETLPAPMLSDAPVDWVQQHQLACVRHACNIASIFERVATLVDTENFVFLDTSLPMCVFDSMCVRLQGLFMSPPESLEQRKDECKTGFKMLIGHIERMSKYFRQAQWLLKEMQKMLHRHGIPIPGITEFYLDSEIGNTDGGSHPWQRRIQRLKNRKAESGQGNEPNLIRDPRAVMAHSQQMAIPAGSDQSTAVVRVDLSNLPVEDSPLYPIPQDMSLDFNQHGDMPFEDHLGIPPNGWGQSQVIPGLANFMGMIGGWTADGLEDGLQDFSEMPRQ